LSRKTDSNNPADWLYMAEADLKAIRRLSRDQIGFHMCRSRLAEVLEKVLKAELIGLGWFLQKTHDLQKLRDELIVRKSKLSPDLADLVESLSESYFTDRYPGFDLDDPDWPVLNKTIRGVGKLLRAAKKSTRNDKK
jgi:HEPN domain-containing protein